jgi:hypothetical protein
MYGYCNPNICVMGNVGFRRPAKFLKASKFEAMLVEVYDQKNSTIKGSFIYSHTPEQPTDSINTEQMQRALASPESTTFELTFRYLSREFSYFENNNLIPSREPMLELLDIHLGRKDQRETEIVPDSMPQYVHA